MKNGKSTLNIDLAGYSPEELEDLKLRADRVIAAKERERRLEVVNDVLVKAHVAGMTTEDLILDLLKHQFNSSRMVHGWLKKQDIWKSNGAAESKKA